LRVVFYFIRRLAHFHVATPARTDFYLRTRQNLFTAWARERLRL
jgi:hypothetical protein